MAWVVCEHIAFDFGRNATALSELIGCIDLTDFRQILPNIQGIMTNGNMSGNYDI